MGDHKHKKSFGMVWQQLMEILMLTAVACLTISFFGGYYLIITTVGHHSRLLTQIAIVFLSCKVIGTRYSLKEFGVILVLLALGIKTWQMTGKNTILLNVLVISAMKNMDPGKVFRVSLFSLIFIVALVGLLAVLQITGPVELTKYYGREIVETRYCFGFIHPNQWAHAMFMILLLTVVSYWEHMNMAAAVILMAGNYAVYRLSVSRTGFLVGTAVIVLMLLYRYAKKWMDTLPVKGMIFLGTLTIWSFPIAAILDTPLGSWIQNDCPIRFNGRLSMAKKYYDCYGMSLFGKKIEDTLMIGSEEIVLDMGYVRFLLENGVIAYIAAFAACCLLLFWAMKKKENTAVVCVIAILVYGFSENIAFSAVPANVTMYFLGRMLFGNQCILKKGQKGIIIKRIS
ncbi:MAG: hypothetical protein ACI4DV_01630 [Lachnospiraceae bacterium]